MAFRVVVSVGVLVGEDPGVVVQVEVGHWIQDHSNYHVEILVVDVLDLEGQKDVHVLVDLHVPWVDLAFEVLDQEEAFLEVASSVSCPEVDPSSFLVDGHVDVDVDFEDLDLEVALVGFLTVLQTDLTLAL